MNTTKYSVLDGTMARLVTLVIMMFFVLIGVGRAQDCSGPLSSLSWQDKLWPLGDQHRTFRVPMVGFLDSVDVDMEVSTTAQGSFAAFDLQSPYIDGDTIWRFGQNLDLGLIFDPDPGQGTSPVVAKLRFSKPVACLQFEISDIDQATGRKDSLVIYANDSTALPVLSVLSTMPTVGVSSNTAQALGGSSGPNGDGTSQQNQDAGSILVDFGQLIIDSVTIVYHEAAIGGNPGGRGIGLWGEMLFGPAGLLPVELLSFGVDRDENCQPIIKWESTGEFALESYLVEYSYDGYNYSKALQVEPQNIYDQVSSYEELLPRKLNEHNYFRLSKVEADGLKEMIAQDVVSGRDCYDVTTVNVYPNPSYKNYFYIEVIATKAHQSHVRIIDQGGQLIVTQPYELEAGKNWMRVSTKSFAPGVYQVQFSTGDEIISRKVSVIR